MFDNELTLYVNQFDNDTALIYPPQLKNEDSVTINDTSIHFAYNSIKCHNGNKPNQDRTLLYYNKDSGYLLAGIFDGHGNEGHRIASFIRSEFLLAFMELDEDESVQKDCLIERALHVAEEKLTENTTINSKRSGSTAAIILLQPQCCDHISLYSSNVGDSECFVSIRYPDGSSSVRSINRNHTLHDSEERIRIENAGGTICDHKLASYLPSVLRVFGNKECTRGGLAMSRSIGDQLIHRFGVISTPSNEIVDFNKDSYKNHTIFIFLGSDGFLSYVSKESIASFFTDASGVSSFLQSALEYAQTSLLKETNHKYADDTSGVVLAFTLL